MDTRSVKEKAIAENYSAFEAMLPLLLQEHEGQYALLRGGSVAGFFDTAASVTPMARSRSRR